MLYSTPAKILFLISSPQLSEIIVITVLSVVVRRDTYYQILGAFNCIWKLYICKYSFFFLSVDSVASLLLEMKSLLYVGNAVIKSLLLLLLLLLLLIISQ